MTEYYNHLAPDYTPFGLLGFAIASLIAFAFIMRTARRKPTMPFSQRAVLLVVAFWASCLGSIVIGWATYIAYYGTHILK